MATLGVFRDDVYNYINALPLGKFTTTAQASGTLAASALTGATEVYVSQSGATALTTDTAVNILEQLLTSIRAASNGLQPTRSTIQGITWVVYVRNTNGGTLTLTAGTGVTITGTATLATAVERQFLVTVTSPTTLTFQDLGGSALQ